MEVDPGPGVVESEMKKTEAAKPAAPEGTVVDGEEALQLVRHFDLKEPH
jgi:hypothetical protein